MKSIKTSLNTKKFSNSPGVSFLIQTYRVSARSPDVTFILVSGKKTGGKLDLMRKMHAPMGPNQAAQHLEFSEEFSTSSRGDKIHTIQIHTKTDSMPFADKFDVRER